MQLCCCIVEQRRFGISSISPQVRSNSFVCRRIPLHSTLFESRTTTSMITTKTSSWQTHTNLKSKLTTSTLSNDLHDVDRNKPDPLRWYRVRYYDYGVKGGDIWRPAFILFVISFYAKLFVRRMPRGPP